MYLTSVSRGANLLLDVGPDKHGLIPAGNRQPDALAEKYRAFRGYLSSCSSRARP